MSSLRYDGPRRPSRSTSARTFPESYYNERNATIDCVRSDPYSYPVGGPVRSFRARSQVDREEFEAPVQHGTPRRRIAVACARCRKRKIRCSGDKGDGRGCQNCRQAGVEASQCQFHRVGSDNVHKVIENYNIAHSLASMASTHHMTPPCLTGFDAPYHRSMQSHQYSSSDPRSAYAQIDTKPSYPPDWAVPYGEDTSPVESFGFDQPSAYLPTPTTATGSNMCGPSYRWTHSTTRSVQPTTSYYSDYGHSYITTGLPYLETDFRPSADNEPTSPLNMSALQLTLQERPRQRQLQPTELPLTPRRQLPVPQPNPSYGLHHALDQQQDQRLRSTQAITTPTYNNATPSYANAFAKPLLPWTAANENLINAITEMTTSSLAPTVTASAGSSTKEASPTFLHTNVPQNEVTLASGNKSSNQLDFGASSLLDPSILTAPIPPAYSNFRESRDLTASSSTQTLRQNSSSDLYSFDSDSASKQSSFTGEDSNTDILVSGRRYTPLSQSGSRKTPSFENISPESFEARDIPSNRVSMSNLKSSY